MTHLGCPPSVYVKKASLLVLFVILFPHVALSENFVRNPSFEVASNPSFPDAWTNYLYPDFYPYERLHLVDDTAYHGAKSLRVNVVPLQGLNKPFTSPYVSCYRIQSLPGMILIPDPQGTYTLSAYLKGNPAGSKVSLGLIGQGMSKNREVELNEEWTRYELTVESDQTAPQTASTPEIFIIALDTASAYTFWVDAVQLEPGSVATPFRPLRESVKTESSPDKQVSFTRETSGKPRIHPPRVLRPPRIDGDLKDTCWSLAEKVGDFVDYKTGRLAKEQTKAYVCRDSENIYIAFRCYNPHGRELEANARGKDDAVWKDDSVEIFLDTNLDGRSHYQFILNAKGVQADVKRGGDVLSQVVGAQPMNDYSWDADWYAATRKNLCEWTAEIRIPFYVLELDKNPPSTWGLNLCRSNAGYQEYSSWAFTKGNFDKATERFGRMDGMVMDPCHMNSTDLHEVEVRWEDPDAGTVGVQCLLDVPTADCGDLDLWITLSEGDHLEPTRITLEKGLQEIRAKGIPLRAAKKEHDKQSRIVLSVVREGSHESLLKTRQSFSLPPLFHAYLDRDYYTRERAATICVDLPETEKKMFEGWYVIIRFLTPPGRIEKPVRSGFQSFQVPIQTLAVGTHDVNVKLFDSRGIIRGERGLAIDLRKPSPHEVKIDRNLGCIRVNDEPFFPNFFGVSSVVPWPHLIPEAASQGFNGILTRFEVYGKHDDMENIRQALDRIRAQGLKLIFWLKPDRDDLAGHHKQDPGYWAAYVHATEKAIRKYIPALKDHPAIIAWKFADEWWNPETTKRLYELCKVLDPYRPAFHNQTGGDTIRWAHPGWFKGDDIFTDIVSWDVYPFGYLDNSNRLMEMLDNVVQQTMIPLAGQRLLPMMFWQQMINIHGRLPTREEYLAEAYLLAMYGVRGLFTFFHKPAAREVWEAAGAFGEELGSLQKIFLQCSPSRSKVRNSGSLRWVYWDGEDGDYLIAVNLSREAIRSRIDLVGAGFSGLGKAEVLFESRSLDVSNGLLEDRFQGLGRHVYVIRSPNLKIR